MKRQAEVRRTTGETDVLVICALGGFALCCICELEFAEE